MSSNLTAPLRASDWKSKQKSYSRDRMKITINLPREQAQAWINFKSSVKPEQMTDDQFANVIFHMGCEMMHHKTMESTREHLRKAQEDPEVRAQLEAQGVNVEEALARLEGNPDQTVEPQGEVEIVE